MSCDDEMTTVPVHTEEMADCDRIDLAWKRLQVQVRQGDKNVLLRGVSGAVSEGFIAVMGPSGSGKTTLLNALACRLDREVKVSGDFRINGEPYTTSTLKRFLGYVMQDDVHSEVLTVRETLRFVADTRLAKTHTPKQREKRINTVMEQMTLSHVADVRVGRGNSGIAGGEKKRLSVAKELLGNPRMLFLDEPTSNLDSLDALQFVQSLKRLVAKTRCVVVCTIHQPQYKVFSTFERLIMLREGSIIYDGPIQGVREYCAQIGSPCPASANPADHMMAAISSEDRTNAPEEDNRKLEEMFTTGHDLVDVDRGKGRAARYMRTPVPFVIQCRMGLLRSTVLLARRRNEWIIYLIVTVVNAVLVGTVFLRIGTGTSSLTKRPPALFFVVVNQATFGAISTVSVLSSERAVILRERASGNLSALSYFATKAFAEMVWKLPFPIIFSITTYFLIGFQPTAHHFFRYLGTIVLSFLTGMGVAFAVSGLTRAASMASIILPLIMELSRLFAGYFLAPALQSPGLKWIDYLSYIHYGYNAVSQNEMADLVIAGAPQVNWLHSRGLYMSYSESMGILGCYFVVTLIIAYLGVRFVTW